MFEQLKRKRMLIEEQVKGKHNQREGMSSAQRRKLIEKDLSQYNQMLNTMQHFRKSQYRDKEALSPNRTLNDRPFKDTQSDLSKPPMCTPTVKDINPSLELSSLANQFYQLSADPKNDSVSISPQKNNNLVDFYKKQQEQVQAIPTSNLSLKLGEAPKEAEKQLPAVVEEKPEVNINNMDEQSSRRDSQPQIQDEQIKFPKYINSSHTDSNNNSEAIFFTSQFKQFLNNQASSPKKVPSPIQEEPKEQPQAKLQENKSSEKDISKMERNLKKNASGQSLAISNDSSLKYSFINESAIQDIITKKLSNELVIDSMPHSQAKIQGKDLYHFSLGLLCRENCRDFVEFGKMFTLARFIQKREIVRALDELMVNKQLKFQAKTSQIKISHFKEQRSQCLLGHCFYSWQSITKNKKQRVQSLILNKERQLKQKSFKTFKMLLFDRRINNQIDMYYLSKIFQAFKTVTEKESKKANQKAYRLYFKNLKKRMFRFFIEGCYNNRRQIQVIQMSQNHYYYSLLEKYFQSWKKLTPKQQKFVRLAMTTKNVLKETADHRLLQTRTFDFYEVK